MIIAQIENEISSAPRMLICTFTELNKTKYLFLNIKENKTSLIKPL